MKVTIVTRGQALGAAWYLPDERQLTTYEQMFDSITSLMAGRATEELINGHISTGALNDIERATKMATSMVVYYGMSPKVGNVSYYDSTGQSEWNFTKPFSEETGVVIDGEVKRIVEEAYQRAKAILGEHRQQVDQLASVLYENEVIFREDVEKIFGARPWEEEDRKARRKAEEEKAAYKKTLKDGVVAETKSAQIAEQRGEQKALEAGTSVAEDKKPATENEEPATENPAATGTEETAPAAPKE